MPQEQFAAAKHHADRRAEKHSAETTGTKTADGESTRARACGGVARRGKSYGDAAPDTEARDRRDHTCRE